MKYLLFVSVVASILVGCSTTNEIIDEVSDELNLPDRIATGRAKACAYNLDRSDSTMSMIDYQYYTPQFSSGVMDSTYKDSVNERIVFIASMQSPDAETTLLGPLTDYYFERVVDDFTVDESEEDEDFDMWRWQMEASFSITETDWYACVNSSGWSYTGGAHGNGYLFFDYFSKMDGKRLVLEDFTIDMSALLELAEQKFREQQELDPETTLEEAGFWFENNVFVLNDNFYFSDNEMVFVYNAYEIAPYAAGMIDIILPLSELEGVVKW